MPRGTLGIRFWRAHGQSSANTVLTDSDRLEAIRARLSDVETAHGQIALRVAEMRRSGRDDCQTALRAEHAALGELLRVLQQERERLRCLRDDLVERPGRLLANWRVTEKEIVSADATVVDDRLRMVNQSVKRLQVDLAAQLIDLT